MIPVNGVQYTARGVLCRVDGMRRCGGSIVYSFNVGERGRVTDDEADRCTRFDIHRLRRGDAHHQRADAHGIARVIAEIGAAGDLPRDAGRAIHDEERYPPGGRPHERRQRAAQAAG